MAQPPVLADQIQIEPGTTTYGTRVIDREPTDGSLRFADPTVTAILSALVGIRNITGLYLVGRAGDGAPYTSIQAALDDIPDTTDPTAPALVLVMSGQWTENLTISKNGVHLVGLGEATLFNSGASPTVTIVEAPTSIPESVILRNLVIVNTEDAQACVFVSGANNYADGTATVGTAPLTVADTLTIGGLPLTGVAGSRTSGNDDFSVDGITVDIIAAEIAAAINDPLNSFAALVVATSLAGVVTITAQTPGAGGNAITLVTSTGDIVVSGGTLTGGGTTDSQVGVDEIGILDCDLVATGNGGFQVYADTVNNIRVEGGSWRPSSSTSQVWASQVASFRIHGVEWTNDMEFAYDDTADQPYITTSVYEVSHCKKVGDVLNSETGEGALWLTHCGLVGDITAGGDRTLDVSFCAVGDLSLSDTVAAFFTNANRGTATVAAGTPTLAESVMLGSIAFAASSIEVATFDVPQPDTDYTVLLDIPSAGVTGAVTVKTATDFTIVTSGPLTGTINYTVMRQV